MWSSFLPDSYAMLMRPNKTETAVHGCHFPGDTAVCMGKVLAKSWVGVRVCQLLLLLFLNSGWDQDFEGKRAEWAGLTRKYGLETGI